MFTKMSNFVSNFLAIVCMPFTQYLICILNSNIFHSLILFLVDCKLCWHVFITQDSTRLWLLLQLPTEHFWYAELNWTVHSLNFWYVIPATIIHKNQYNISFLLWWRNYKICLISGLTIPLALCITKHAQHRWLVQSCSS